MEVQTLVEKLEGALGAQRVYGVPIERDGMTVIPAATVRGGGGGGGGNGAPGASGAAQGQGEGAGFGLSARPAGVFIVRGGSVRWQPAVDVNRFLLGMQLVAAAALLLWRAKVLARPRAPAWRRLRRS